MEHGYGHWEKQSYCNWTDNELDNYNYVASKVANQFDDYATQLEELAKKARELSQWAEDEADITSETFYSDAPEDRYNLPSEETKVYVRNQLLSGMKFLAKQLIDDNRENE